MRRAILSTSCLCTVLLSSLACGTTTPGADGKPDAKAEPATPATPTTPATPEKAATPEPVPEVTTAAPEPTPPAPEPVEPVLSRLPLPPTPDLAVVQTATGVEVLDDTGKSLATLVPHPVSWCRVDPRADVLWFRHGDDGTLAYLDLRNTDPATKLLAASPDTIVIDYGDESLGRLEDHKFTDGLVVHMQTPPKLESILGCDGDMFFYCFEGEGEGELEEDGEIDIEAARAKRLEQLAKDLAAHPILAPDQLAALVARSAGRRATLPDPERSPAPTTVANVPKDGCEEEPDDCGKARRLPGTPHWLVVVGNGRGDFYHETLQLHDPATHEFFDALDPKRRSATPLEAGDDVFTPVWVSPGGTMLSGDSRLVKLGSGAVAKDLEGSCGFWGGGWQI
jgi:hypothetical protein